MQWAFQVCGHLLRVGKLDVERRAEVQREQMDACPSLDQQGGDEAAVQATRQEDGDIPLAPQAASDGGPE